MSIRKANDISELDEMVNQLGSNIKSLTVVGLKKQEMLIKLKYIQGLLSYIECSDPRFIPAIRRNIPDCVNSEDYGVCWIHGYATMIKQDMIFEFIDIEFEECEVPYYHDRLDVLNRWGFKTPSYHLVDKGLLMVTLNSIKTSDFYTKDILIVPYIKQPKPVTESPIIFSL